MQHLISEEPGHKFDVTMLGDGQHPEETDTHDPATPDTEHAPDEGQEETDASKLPALMPRKSVTLRVVE